jgi:hypothetical protein
VPPTLPRFRRRRWPQNAAISKAAASAASDDDDDDVPTTDPPPLRCVELVERDCRPAAGSDPVWSAPSRSKRGEGAGLLAG